MLKNAKNENVYCANDVLSFMYTVICTHPDISFVIGLVSRYQVTLVEVIDKPSSLSSPLLERHKEVTLCNQGIDLIGAVIWTYADQHLASFSCLEVVQCSAVSRSS